MNYSDTYLHLPHDISGSRTKNRFRIELLWGISKMFDMMQTSSEFVIVFDYVCDIEIHLNGGFEFYQIKTHKNGNSYSLTKLTERKESGRSIVGRLYLLKHEQVSRLCVVSNVPLKVGKSFVEAELTNLGKIPEAELEKISAALASELAVENVELSDVYYLYTQMDLCNPEDAVRGKIIRMFKDIKGGEPENPNALWKMIFDTVKDRACFECVCRDYKEIISKKGLSREDVDRMLEAHDKCSKAGVISAKEYIFTIKEIYRQRALLSGLTRVLEHLVKSTVLREVEHSMASALLSGKIGNGKSTQKELVENIFKSFRNRIPTEYSDQDCEALAILVVSRFKEGGYDAA